MAGCRPHYTLFAVTNACREIYIALLRKTNYGSHLCFRIYVRYLCMYQPIWILNIAPLRYFIKSYFMFYIAHLWPPEKRFEHRCLRNLFKTIRLKKEETLEAWIESVTDFIFLGLGLMTSHQSSLSRRLIYPSTVFGQCTHFRAKFAR